MSLNLNHLVRNSLRNSKVQSPHFRIEAVEVKKEISGLAKFIHLVSDRVTSRTQDSRFLTDFSFGSCQV